MNRSQLSIALSCRLLVVLQSSTQAGVHQWSIDTLEHVFRFTSGLQKMLSNLQEEERISLIHFVSQSIMPLFLHLPSDLVMDDAFRHPLNSTIKVLCANVDLAQHQRDYIIKYCREANPELLKFTSVSELTDPSSSYDRRQLARLKQFVLDLQQQAEKDPVTGSASLVLTFLDSCYGMNPSYSVNLMLRCLLHTANRTEFQLAASSLLSWLTVAVGKDNNVRNQLLSQNGRFIRDLCIILPDFGDTFVQLFNGSYPLQPDGDLDASQVAATISCLLKADLYTEHLPSLLTTLATVQSDSVNARFWQDVTLALHAQ